MEHRNKYCYSFPAVRGEQAGRPFYIATCPLRLIPKIFTDNEEGVSPEFRAQRELNKQRIPQMVQYLLKNPKDYIFSALTASVDTSVEFYPLEQNPDLGTLCIDMTTNILINDGQHRRRAIVEALKKSPQLGQDNIPVVFFLDEGLSRSQQMFADLNKNAVRPSSSISVLYDKRDYGSEIARFLSQEVLPFAGYTEMERTSISLSSTKLFTLSNIKQATCILLGKTARCDFDANDCSVAEQFWMSLNDSIYEWKLVQCGDILPSEVRKQYIHVHSIGLQALGLVGKGMICMDKFSWQSYLNKFKKIDWRKANPMWNNRAIHNGRLSKSSTSIKLTANIIKQAIGLELSDADKEVEKLLK